MKNPINKSNIRRPLKIILLFIVLLVISNLFISGISQFYIVNREINNIGAYYRSIGAISPIGEMRSIREAQKIITHDKMIEFEDVRRSAKGIIDGLYVNERSSNVFEMTPGLNILDLVFIGEVREVYKNPSDSSSPEGTTLVVRVRDILGGIPDFIESELQYKDNQEHSFSFLSNSPVTGEEFEYFNDSLTERLFRMEPGKTYLFRTFIEVGIPEGSFAKPLYDGGPLYIELDDKKSIDWNESEFSIIKKEIDFINKNIISYNITSTKDMTVMEEVQDNVKTFSLVEGRWLNREDDEEQNHVVVIHRTIANMYNINIGDNLDIKVEDTETGEVAEPKPFEIVGIFEMNFRPGSFYRSMYIPDSTMPMNLGGDTKVSEEPVFLFPGSYNFILRNIEDESAFIEKYKTPLEELGYKISFFINDAESFFEASNSIKISTFISVVVFTILLLLIQGFVIYVYVDGHKLNYAIERVLGIPARISGRHLIRPIIIFGLIASVMGGYLGYNNAIKKSMELLGDISSTTLVTIDSGLDIKYFLLFIALSMVPFFLMLLMKVNQFKKLAVIDLINNKNKRGVKGGSKSFEMKRATNISKESDYEENESTKNIVYTSIGIKEENQKIIGKNSQRSLKRFSLNYIFRSKITSILLITLTGIFVFSLLWMNYLTIKNGEIIEKSYKAYNITADIIISEPMVSHRETGLINGKHISNLMETDLIEDYSAIASMTYDELYRDRAGVIEKYEFREDDRFFHPGFVVKSTNKRYNSSDSTVELKELNFIEGYSLDDFYRIYTKDYSKSGTQTIVDEKGEEGFPILVSNKAMEYYELELGDRIFLEPNLNQRSLLVEAYGTIAGTFKEADSGKNHYGYSIMDEQNYIFIYPISALEAIEGGIYYDKMEFKFKTEKNKELLERKEELRNIVANNSFNKFATKLMIWDGELTNVVEPLEKNVSLLGVLYPISLVLSILIIGIFTFITVSRRIIDVAILRILGVKNKEVIWNLSKENLMLVVTGIIVACITIIAITVNSYSIDLCKYFIICGGYLLGAIIGLILGIGKVTNKKPLEMLQVKE